MVCYLTWRAKATKSGRSIYQLAPSMPRTGGNGFGLLPTATASNTKAVRSGLWPTPKASPSGPDYARAGREKSGGDDFATAVAREMWPTPAARDYRHPNKKPYSERGGGSKGEQLPNAVGGALNPEWVEWLMGFPPGWTALEPSEMP